MRGLPNSLQWPTPALRLAQVTMVVWFSLDWFSAGGLVPALLPFAGDHIEQVSVWTFGIWLGFGTASVFPEAIRSGRWVWLGPITTILVILVLTVRQQSPWQTMVELVTPESSGAEPGALALFTYPAVTSILYSVVMAIAEHRRRA